MLRRVRLWNAAMNGDVNEFLYQINRFQRESNVSTSLKEYINSRNEANGHNALTSACIGGHLSIIKYLIYYGANIYYQDKRKMTPLHHLAIHGHGSCIKFILLICNGKEKQKELINVKDFRGLTALDLAEVAQRDWIYARERVDKIGSFLNMTKSTMNQRLIANEVELDNRFIHTISLLTKPPTTMRNAILNSISIVEEENGETGKRNKKGEKKNQTKRLNHLNSSFMANHKIIQLVLPNKEHQRMLQNACRHCPELKTRLLQAKTIRDAKSVINVMKAGLGIQSNRFDIKMHRKKKEKELSDIEKKEKKQELEKQHAEMEFMFSEDANALKIRKYLTADVAKLEYIENIFVKLISATDLDDTNTISNTTRVDGLTPLFFAKFLSATGELVNGEQTRVILKTIRDLSTKEHGIWPPPHIGIVEFTIFWLLGEENAKKEAMKPLPRWMNHKNKNNNINNNAELNMQVAAKAALPKPTWLKRFKARILVNSKVNTVSQSTSRTSIFARIMNRVKLSFDEKKVEEEGDISPYASYMHLSHAPYANSIPIIEKKVAKVKLLTKDQKRLKKEMMALGNMGGDDDTALEKAERISKAQQKTREENTLKAKQEAERQEKQAAKLKKREQREMKKKELIKKKKAKLRKEKMKEALKLENKRKRNALKLKKSQQRAIRSGSKSNRRRR